MKFLYANFAIAFGLALLLFFQVTSEERASIAAVPRAIASIGPLPSPFPKATEKVKAILVENQIEWTFLCDKPLRHFKTQQDQIYISAKKCPKGKLKNISMVNTSNGFTASVFEVSLDQYKTDLIPLSKGINEIFVEYQLENDVELIKEKFSIEKSVSQ